jgi:hypothetical protein
MDRRAKRPLDPAAASAADDEIYSNHAGDPRPNALYDAAGNRKPLSATDPAQADLRREWMDSYIANGGKVESPASNLAPPSGPSVPCSSATASAPPPTSPPPPPQKANLHVKLEHFCDKSPLNNGTVKISGPESHQATTGADGWAKFDGITPGTYTIDGTHPQHQPGNTSANAPAATTTSVELPLHGNLQIAAVHDAYTVVLDKTGNPPGAFPILEFNITNGPPNHLFDVQLSRAGGDPSGGPGLGGSWVEADGRDARMSRQVFSSWSNGAHTLRLDGSGNGSFKMPLEWWRDQARQKRSDFTEFTYQCRAVAFKDGPTAVCTEAPAVSVKVRNNLVDYKLVDNGYIDANATKSIRMEFKVREANTTEMYTFVQWMQGSDPQWKGSPPVQSYPTHQLYNITHDYNFPDFTIDRLRMDPRYHDGTYTITDGGLTASSTDAPGGSINAGYSHDYNSLDFETRVHLNFEVPATVTIIRKDGAPPVYGVVTGKLADPQPIIMDSATWNIRILQVRQPDGSVTVTHPNTFAGP